jgi:hypothetical protein
MKLRDLRRSRPATVMNTNFEQSLDSRHKFRCTLELLHNQYIVRWNT